MKKEVFLAISIGFILGLIITFGIWTANKSLKQLPQPSPTPAPLQTDDSTVPGPSASPANQIPFSLSAPADELLVTTNSVTVTGTTSAGASVALLYEGGEAIVTADASGQFTFDVPLEGGYNRITITAYDSQGKSATQSILVTYTTQKL